MSMWVCLCVCVCACVCVSVCVGVSKRRCGECVSMFVRE